MGNKSDGQNQISVVPALYSISDKTWKCWHVSVELSFEFKHRDQRSK